MTVVSALTGAVTALFKTKRKIGSFSAQVTIAEDHSDEVQATDHPVEYGAMITDHAIVMPARLTVTIGFSNSGGAAVGAAIGQALSGDILGALKGVAAGDYIRTMYQNFLTLEQNRLPFAVVTGKRNYKNMIITSITTTTDDKTENALILVVAMREIITVQTQAVTLAPTEDQANPEETADTTNAGTKQAVPATVPNAASLGKTLLKSGADFIKGGL